MKLADTPGKPESNSEVHTTERSGSGISTWLRSTHGISGWRPLVFGSIAEKVAEQVQCPLLLLRSVELAPNCAASTPQS